MWNDKNMGGDRKNMVLPVLLRSNKTTVSSKEKTEPLADTFVQIHSSWTLAARAVQCSEDTLAQNLGQA